MFPFFHKIRAHSTRLTSCLKKENEQTFPLINDGLVFAFLEVEHQTSARTFGCFLLMK